MAGPRLASALLAARVAEQSAVDARARAEDLGSIAREAMARSQKLRERTWLEVEPTIRKSRGWWR